MAFADIYLELCADSASDLTVVKNVSVGAGVVISFPPAYSVDEHIRRWTSRLDACWFSILLMDSKLTVMVGRSECGAAYAGWRCRWRHWSGRRAVDDHTHVKFMDLPFVRSVEELPYERLLAQLVPKIRSGGFFTTAADLNLWYGGDQVC